MSNRKIITKIKKNDSENLKNFTIGLIIPTTSRRRNYKDIEDMNM